MNYLATVSFDIYNADSDARDAIYQSLRQIGLTHYTGDLLFTRGDTLPETTVVGEFDAASAETLRDDLMLRVQAIISIHGYRSKIFIGVGTDWAWKHDYT